jgi:hypothetical protein
LQHAPIDFPLLFPIACYFILFKNPAEERKKAKKRKEKHRSEFTLQFKPLLNLFVNFNYTREENLCFTHLKRADR